jgi:16S rRNA (guanine(966)-N(2))-methyltransferase RsmD
LRIISGKYKGKRFTPPKGFSARPTTDFARESLFNILNTRYDFDDLSVLDLFAGTGSIGIEFASRGSSPVTMVELNSKHYIFIRNSISALDLPGTSVVHSNVKSFLKGTKDKYDIIFADPPFNMAWLEEVPDLVLNAGIMKSDAIFIMEHPKSVSFNSHPLFSEHRNYGSVNFTFFSHIDVSVTE